MGAGVISVSAGRCTLRLADMARVQVSDWVHTPMVSQILSQMEVMVPEMQHVLQAACVMTGSFSSLDLAAANRLHIEPGTPNMIALYHYAKRLSACEELVRTGF